MNKTFTFITIPIRLVFGLVWFIFIGGFTLLLGIFIPDKITVFAKICKHTGQFVLYGLRFGMMSTSDEDVPYLVDTWTKDSSHERMFREWCDTLSIDVELKRANEEIEKLRAELKLSQQANNTLEIARKSWKEAAAAFRKDAKALQKRIIDSAGDGRFSDIHRNIFKPVDKDEK